MHRIIVSNIDGNIIVSADTLGELLQPKTDKVMLRFLSARSLFFPQSQHIVIGFLGKTVVSGIFFETILDHFVRTLENVESELSIKDLQSKFSSYIKRSWPEINNLVYKEEHLLFIKIYPDHRVEVDRLLHHEEDGFLQRRTTKIILVSPNEKVVFDMSGLRILSSALDDEDILNEEIRCNSKPFPYETFAIAISRFKKQFNQKRFYLKHQFKHVDDFVEAHVNGHFGAQIFNPFRRIDIIEAFPAQSTLNNKPGLERFMTYKGFISLSRSKFNIQDVAISTFYRHIYHLINEAAHNDCIFSYKLRTIINNGIIFLLDRATEENRLTLAYYERSWNWLTFHVNVIDNLPDSMQVRILKHEVEHAFQAAIHKKRWLYLPTSEDPNPELKNKFGLTLPFFPQTYQEQTYFLSLIEKGYKRVFKLLDLLHQDENTLTDHQRECIKKYLNSVDNYKPKILISKITLSKGKQLCVDTPMKQSRVFLNQYKINFNITVFSIVSKKETDNESIFECLFFHCDKTLALILDLLDIKDTFNNDPTELHAHIVEELRYTILSLLFPELLQYAYADMCSAYNDIPTEYQQFIRKIDSEFDEKLFTGPSPAIMPINVFAPDATYENINRIAHGLIPEPLKEEFHVVTAALDIRNYGKALRCLCTTTKPVSKDLITHLLNNKSVLRLDINELANGKTALFYAATKSTQEIYNLLLEHGADSSIVIEGKTIKDYVDERFEQQHTLTLSKNEP